MAQIAIKIGKLSMISHKIADPYPTQAVSGRDFSTHIFKLSDSTTQYPFKRSITYDTNCTDGDQFTERLKDSSLFPYLTLNFDRRCW